MADVKEKAKDGLKLLGTASVQMMIGGVVAAVMPPQVSAIFKTAAYIGSCVAAMCVSDPIDRVVDKQFETMESVIGQVKTYAEIIKQSEVKEESTE